MAYFLKNKSHLTIVTIIFIFVLSLTSLDNTSNYIQLLDSRSLARSLLAGQLVRERKGGITIPDAPTEQEKKVRGIGAKEKIISLNQGEKVKVGLMYGILAVITVISFILAVEVGVMYLALGGLAIVCFILGLRHGVDADHIAAIDNTTRKLLQEEKRPLTVGMWFSIGHAITVGLMVISIIFAAQFFLRGDVQFMTDTISTLVSGIFLFLIATINLIIVRDIYRVFKGLKAGTINQSQLSEELDKKGFMNTHFKWLFKLVDKPYKMIIVGLLFGLGFDTATETMTIGLAVGVGVTGIVPVWAIMTLPLCFACGMIFTDMSDGISMRLAYGWAFQHPIRKVYYNLTITIMSVMVAFAIGGVELTQCFAAELGWNSGFWGWLQALDFEVLGFFIVAMFVSSWLIAMWYYRHKKYEEMFDNDKFLGGSNNPPPIGGIGGA